MKRINWLASVCLVASVAGQARAETKLTVPLNWQHQPRKAEDNLTSYQTADVEGGFVMFMRWKNGSRAFYVGFQNGVICSSLAEGRAPISMTCGAGNGYYLLAQRAGEQAKLEWIVPDDAKPAAERKAEPAPPKAKVRL